VTGRYNVTSFRSREGPPGARGDPIIEPAGRRSPSLPTSGHRSPVRLALAGSIALHAGMLIALLAIVGRTVQLMPREPEAVTLVFQAAPEPTQAPPQPPPAIEPAPQSVAVPQPPEPTPVVPPERPPVPPPEPEPLPTPAPTAEPPLPPPPVVQPPSVRHLPPPRPSGTPARPQPARTPTPPQRPDDARSAQTAPVAALPTPAPAVTISRGWQNALGAWLQAHKTYPEEARRRGEQGRATVRFTVARNGRVLDVELVTGTGSVLLDQAVEHLLQGAQLPPFSPDMDQAQVTVTLQIRYALER
jgi:periplasmic protein TonB